MYERLYKDVSINADDIIAEAMNVGTDSTGTKRDQMNGLASRTVEGVAAAMEETRKRALSAFASRQPDEKTLKANISSYIKAIKDSYVEQSPEEQNERLSFAPPMRPAKIGTTKGSSNRSTIGERLVRDLMKDYGISRAYAAGIVGNLDYETMGFTHMQEVSPLVKGSRGGFGYAQWTGPRRIAFEKYARENKLDPTSYEANYGFLKHEIGFTREGNFLDDYEDINDAEEAARVFSRYYLRPSKRHANMEERIRRARLYAEEI